MPPQFPDKSRPRRVAMVPLLLGLAISIFGLMMIVNPERLVRLAVALAGLFVLTCGVGLMLVGLDLWLEIPKIAKNLGADEWRFWQSEKDDKDKRAL
jgi:hypothetical protein